MSRAGRTLIGVGVAATAVGLLITYAGSSSSNTGSSVIGDTYTAPPEPSPSPTVAALSAADAAKQNDKGWVMEDFRLHRDAAGGAQGTARLKNANGTVMSAGFTVTMLNGEVPLMSWRGTALSVPPEQTVTVDMLTPDAVPPNQTGNIRLAFQVDSSVPS